MIQGHRQAFFRDFLEEKCLWGQACTAREVRDPEFCQVLIHDTYKDIVGSCTFVIVQTSPFF